jgi:hypothetical protein
MVKQPDSARLKFLKNPCPIPFRTPQSLPFPENRKKITQWPN